jgi:hypothetical protein
VAVQPPAVPDIVGIGFVQGCREQLHAVAGIGYTQRGDEAVVVVEDRIWFSLAGRVAVRLEHIGQQQPAAEAIEAHALPATREGFARGEPADCKGRSARSSSGIHH